MQAYDRMTAQDLARKTRVLLVEDSAPERLRLSTIVQRLGYQSDEAENGLEALNKLRETPFDIVLSDWIMPELDGLSLCQQIRADANMHQPYFIMLTGQNSPADLVAGMDGGADDFIGKPASHEELRVRLQAGLRMLQMRANAPASAAPANAETARSRTKVNPQRDLGAVARLQESMLPALDTLPPALSVDYLFRTAENIGGVALGAYDMANGLANFFVVDCHSHDIAAAMQTIEISRRLTPARRNDDLVMNPESGPQCPSEAAAQLNRELCDGKHAHTRLGLAYGVINWETGSTRICVAGTPRPLLLRADGSSQWLNIAGPTVGTATSSSYTADDLHLDPGDHLLLYTDGLFRRAGSLDDSAALGKRYVNMLQSCRADNPRAIVDATQLWLDQAGCSEDVALLALSR